jgi:ribosomal protein S18
MSSSDDKSGAKGAGLPGDEDLPLGSTRAGGAFKEAHPVDLPMDDFELRVLGISSKKDDGEDDDLLRELEEIERSSSWRAAGGPTEGESEDESDMDEDDDDDDEDWEDERVQVLSDAALSAIVDYDLDDEQRPYQFRPDRIFFPGQTYDPEDLDLSKKPDELERPPPRYRRKFDNKEVLQRADFRNPRYLSNFIAETSRILPKRRSGLTAKAQRKVIREIKTARTFGLMPFTSMGRSPFRFLRSRLDEDDSNSSNH